MRHFHAESKQLDKIRDQLDLLKKSGFEVTTSSELKGFDNKPLNNFLDSIENDDVPLENFIYLEELKDQEALERLVKLPVTLLTDQKQLESFIEKIGVFKDYPDELTLSFKKVNDLRYGENPHQKAAFYQAFNNSEGSLVEAEQLQGKELSYNNINDTNGALEIIKEFDDEPTIVAVKHANACAIASADTLYQAYMNAYEADPTSIFGGIVAANREITADIAKEMVKIFLEVIVAPDYSEEALEIFKEKPNLRVLKLEDILSNNPGFEVKSVLGGLLVQNRDDKLIDELKTVTKREPTEKEMEDLLFAWKAVKNTKSNAISLAKDKVLIANGPGQVNRVWPTENCITHAGEKANGSVLASDAFFPFDDCVKLAAEAGITAIIQPGGSIRDQDSIDVCDDNDIAMVFTGMRHFKHS